MYSQFLTHQRCSPQCSPVAGHHRVFPSSTGRVGHRGLSTIVAARPKVVPEESLMVERLERPLHLPSPAAPEQTRHAAEASASRSKHTVDEGEVLHSTNEHRAWVYGATALISALLCKGVSEIHTWQGVAGSAAAVLAAYLFSGADRASQLGNKLVHSTMCC